MRDDDKDQKNSKLSKRDGRIEINIHMWLAYHLKSSIGDVIPSKLQLTVTVQQTLERQVDR